MENSNESNEDNLWNKYENLQKRMNEKSTYYQSSIKYFGDIISEIDNHLIKLTLINNDVKLKNPTKLDELFNLIIKLIQLFSDNHKKLINNIINHLKKYLSDIKKENPYNNFKQFYNYYKSEQKKFNQTKNKFNQIALQAETKTLKKVQKKNETNSNEEIDLPKQLKKDLGQNLKKYQTSLIDMNKMREDYNKKETNFINYFAGIEKDELNMYYDALNDFVKIEFEKIKKFFAQESIQILFEKYKKKDIEKEKEIKEIDKKMENNEKKDEKFSFEFKSNIDFENCNENDEFKSYIETVEIIKKNFNNIYEDIELEKERLKNNVRELIKKFFELDKTNEISEIKEEDEKKYFNSLNDPETHPTFIKVLSNLRTNSKLKRKKKVIDILAKSFKIILDNAEKNNNEKSFWAARNCLILSQTFWYEKEDEKNKISKIYAFEYLKADTWLVKKDFWMGYIFWVVEEELKKFIKIFPDITFEDIRNNKIFPPKISTKISEILFSQLLPAITNLLEVTKKNMYAVEIIEIFHEKFSYLTEEKIEALFQLFFYFY